MLENIIIREFIEKFSALYGKKANVQIRHLFYGNQKLNRCVLHPFADEECIGLIMDDGEKKYITMDELCEVNINENVCIIKSKVMELYIDHNIL